MSTAHFAVPTASVIGHRRDNPFEVACFRSSKFECTDRSGEPAFVIVGGKVEIGRGQTPLQCANIEWAQEAGGVTDEPDIVHSTSTILHPRLALVVTDLVRDVRPGKTIAKITDGHCPPEIAEVTVDAHYGAPDHVVFGAVSGDITVDGRELLSWEWLDINALDADSLINRFGAGHGMMLAAYREWLRIPDAQRYPLAIGNFGQIADMLRANGTVDLTKLTAR